MGGEPDLTAIPDFSKVKNALETLPNVKSVVPMGISGALVTSGNTIDLALERLRALVKKRDAAGDATGRARLAEQVAAEKGHVRQILSVLQGDLKNTRVVLDDKA